MTPRTDVCHIREKHRESIKLSLSEEEKLAAPGRFQAHLTQAAQEREHCTFVCKEDASSLARAIDAQTVPSTNHYTSDVKSDDPISHSKCSFRTMPVK